MRSGIHRLRGIFLGGVTAVTSSAIVLGSFVLAFTEGGRSLALAPSPTLQATSLPTRLPPTLPPPTATPTTIASSTPTATPTTSATLTATGCPSPPDDWIPYTTERGDTLTKLAEAFDTTQDELIDVNCLAASQLEPGTTLYVPGFIPTSPPERCGPPSGWVPYIVQRGDTWSNLSQRLNRSIDELKWANCLNRDTIYAGEQLYVPFQPYPRPSPTQRPTETRPPPPPPTDTPPPPPTDTPPPPPPTPTEDNIHDSTPPPPSAASGTTSAP